MQPTQLNGPTRLFGRLEYIARSKTSVLMIEMELLVQFLRVKTISTFIHLQKFKNTFLLAGIT